jgi:DNA-binding beta-propeller fold protein YncE
MIGLIGAAPANAGGGDELWVKRYDGPSGRDDQPYSLATSPDGSRVFVTGTSRGQGTLDDYLTLAYDTTNGSTLWERRYNGPGNAGDHAYALSVSPDGARVFVTGTSDGVGTGNDYATLAYDATTGMTLWRKRYSSPGKAADFALALAVSADGSRVFATGGIGVQTCSCDFDYATIAYDAATGRPLWQRSYNGPVNSGDEAQAIAVSPGGEIVFVTGWSFGASGSYDYLTIAYDAETGVARWLKRYNGPGDQIDYVADVAVSPDGTRVFVTGLTDGWAAYATLAYSANSGGLLWMSRYDGPAGNNAAASLVVNPDGSRVFVTGNSVGLETSNDYATVAYDAASGEELWVSRYDGPGNRLDYGVAVAVSPDGAKVFVTGSSDAPGADRDYATLAYNAATGDTLWETRYAAPPPSFDAPAAIGVSPDGLRVFVTGLIESSNVDFATVAYEG